MRSPFVVGAAGAGVLALLAEWPSLDAAARNPTLALIEGSAIIAATNGVQTALIVATRGPPVLAFDNAALAGAPQTAVKPLKRRSSLQFRVSGRSCHVSRFIAISIAPQSRASRTQVV
jgi:hypothetical protein